MSADTTDPVQHKFYLCDRIAQLERELNDAKARIAQLEDAGDKLETCAKYACTDELVSATVDEWRKAKL